MISAAQCRCARTLLRWSVNKLASVASVSESAIDNFELERRQANARSTPFSAPLRMSAWCSSPKTMSNCVATHRRKVTTAVLRARVSPAHLVQRSDWIFSSAGRLTPARPAAPLPPSLLG